METSTTKREASTAHAGGSLDAFCPACREQAPEPFFALESMPVLSNVLHASEAAALSAVCSDIAVALCPKCALIYNPAFDPALIEYSPQYVNPLHVSSVFRAYADELCRRLIADHDLAGGVAVEIGCGDGFFLQYLIDHGMREAIGYDPAIRKESVQQASGWRLHLVPELFEKHHLVGPVDAVVCRHVFEHLASPATFLADLRDMIGDRKPLIYFEVPNAEWIIRSFSLWDVTYEHVTYWTSAAITALFNRSGFAPLAVSTGFGDQFLKLEAKPGPRNVWAWPSHEEVARIARLCRQFGKECTQLASRWCAAVHDLAAEGRTIVLWGIGTRGVTFANLIAAQGPWLAGLADINLNKQGKYVASCGLPILTLDELKALRPDIILLMNANYRAEVAACLDELGLKPEIWDVGRWSERSSGYA